MSDPNRPIPPGLKHVIHFYDAVTLNSFDALYRTMITAVTNHQAGSIELLMSSTGGVVNVGMTAYGLLSSLPVPLTTINLNSVDSISVLLFLAGKVRYCKPHARFIIHEFSQEVTQRVNYNRFMETSKSLEFDVERYAAIFQERTQAAESPLDIRKCLGGGSKIVSASEAIRSGICTGILSDEWVFDVPAVGAYHWKLPAVGA